MVTIIEIPATDFHRAKSFYQTVLNLNIEEMKMGDTQMGIIPPRGEGVNLILIKGADYRPSRHGALLYLNAGTDLQPILDKVESEGGQVLLGKTFISPEMGYYAQILDSEGNRIGLHSQG